MNEIIKISKQHYAQYSSQKRTYTRVTEMVTKQKHIKGLGRCRFRFDWFCPDRRRDPDNISAAQKFIFDGFKEAGVIRDDNWAHVAQINHRFHIDRRYPRVEVTIVELEAAQPAPAKKPVIRNTKSNKQKRRKK